MLFLQCDHSAQEFKLAGYFTPRNPTKEKTAPQ